MLYNYFTLGQHVTYSFHVGYSMLYN